MRMFLLLSLLGLALSGCTYQYVCNAHDGTVAADPTKSTAVNPAIQGNVPVQGGTVLNPSNEVKK